MTKTMGPMGSTTWKAWVWNSPQWWEDVSYAIQTCLGLWLALLGPIAGLNGPNGRFNLPPASHLPLPPPTPYNTPSVILQWFWKKLLKIQQYKLANRNGYKAVAKRLFQFIQYSVSCQFSDIGLYNKLSNEQKWSKSEQKWSISEQTRLFARNVP